MLASVMNQLCHKGHKTQPGPNVDDNKIRQRNRHRLNMPCHLQNCAGDVADDVDTNMDADMALF